MLKKTIKTLITSVVIILMLFSVFVIEVSAASVSVGGGNYTVGQSFTIRVNYNSGGAPIYTSHIDLTYNSSVLQLTGVSGAEYKTSGSTVSITDDKLSNNAKNVTSGSYSLSFKAISVGSSSIKVSAYGVDGQLNKLSASSGSTITVSTPAPSSNANLSSLRIDGVGLSPAFSQNVTTYNASVANSVETISIKAMPASGDAVIVGIGDKKLNEGDNSFTITVTAPSGAKKTYTLNIRRRLPGELTTEEKLTVTIGEEQKKVQTDISSLPVLNGFTQGTENYKDIQVGVLHDSDNKYTLYYLTDTNGENAKLYTLNSNGEFEPLPCIDFAGKTFIVEDAKEILSIPQGYKEKTFSINEKDFKAYGFENSKMNDFYILYCFDGENREYYTYDSSTGILQRFPMFSAIEEAKPVSKEKPTLINQFKKLPLLFKGIMLLSPIALILIIVLIILLAVSKNRNNRNYFDDDDTLLDLNSFNLDLSNKYLDSDDK